jgi:hypothetical protein
VPSVRVVREEEETVAPVTRISLAPRKVWVYIGVSAVSLAVIGTWLVWFSAFVQWKFQEQEIRAACQRAMPETVDRCFDTVVIQRGGIRR